MADNTASYITNLYQTMLGRAPEAGAIDYWSKNPTGNIANGIFGSQEYTDRLSQTYNQYGNDPAALNAQLKAQGWTDSGTGPMKPPGYGQFATNYITDVAKKEAATATNGWGTFAPPSGHAWSSVYPNAGVQQPGQQTHMPYNAAPPAWLQGLMASINNSKGVQGSSLYGGTNSTSTYPPETQTALNTFMQGLLGGQTGVGTGTGPNLGGVMPSGIVAPGGPYPGGRMVPTEGLAWDGIDLGTGQMHGGSSGLSGRPITGTLSAAQQAALDSLLQALAGKTGV